MSAGVPERAPACSLRATTYVGYGVAYLTRQGDVLVVWPDGRAWEPCESEPTYASAGASAYPIEHPRLWEAHMLRCHGPLRLLAVGLTSADCHDIADLSTREDRVTYARQGSDPLCVAEWLHRRREGAARAAGWALDMREGEVAYAPPGETYRGGLRERARWLWRLNVNDGYVALSAAGDFCGAVWASEPRPVRVIRALPQTFRTLEHVRAWIRGRVERLAEELPS